MNGKPKLPNEIVVSITLRTHSSYDDPCRQTGFLLGFFSGGGAEKKF